MREEYVKTAERGFGHLQGFVSAFSVLTLQFYVHYTHLLQFQSPTLLTPPKEIVSQMGNCVKFSIGLVTYSEAWNTLYAPILRLLRGVTSQLLLAKHVARVG